MIRFKPAANKGAPTNADVKDAGKMDMATGAAAREQFRMSSACIVTLNNVDIMPINIQHANIAVVAKEAG